MSEIAEIPWWRKLFSGMAFLVGVLALSGALASLIVVVAAFFETSSSPNAYRTSSASRPESSQPAEVNAMTRVPTAYSPRPWPDYPGRNTVARFAAERTAKSSAGKPRASAPVGISVEEYQSTVTAGESVFLPDPTGECTLSGLTGADFILGLQSCFAARAPR